MILLNLERHFLPQGIFCINGPFTRSVLMNSRKYIQCLPFHHLSLPGKQNKRNKHIMITITQYLNLKS